jgi:hypothetical protein
MKHPVKAAIVALCAIPALAATLLAQAPAPKAVPVEPIKDVGTIAKGEKIVHDFVLRNDGTAPLEVTNVQPACGCTVAEFDKTIAPGKTGKIHAVLDTTTFNGPISKGVTVFTSDPENPRIELTVRAKVEPYISVKPGYARYITVKGESAQGTIAQTVWAPDGTPFEIVKADSPVSGLAITYREATETERQPDGKGKQWHVEMTLGNDAPVGPLADYVTITTNHPKQKVVQIPVSGFVRPVIAVTPPVADFGQIQLPETMRKVLNLRNFASESIAVTSVESQLPAGVEAQLEPLEPGREYQVRLTLKPEMAKGPFAGKLMVKTDSPKTPVIEVEVKGTVL